MRRHPIPAIALAALFLCAGLPQVASGQERGRDKRAAASKEARYESPLQQARAMREEGRKATEAVAALERQWRQGPREAASTLLRAGYTTRAVATAFARHPRVSREEVPGLLVQTGLDPDEAIAAADARSFRDPVFEVVALDCVGPNGFPVPCGIQGGAAAAMGSLSWSPQGEGYVGETLTIEGANIPEVTVRLGTAPLSLLEATPNRVRARLPSQPTTGDLVLVRESDGQVGTLQPNYEVVEPPPPAGEPDPVADPAAWAEWGEVAFDAAIAEGRAWTAGARIVESLCRVDGPAATGKPGVLTSDYRFEGLIRKELERAGAPAKVADGWQRAFEEWWTEWADGAMIPGLPWYPSFSTVPAEEAPPTPNVPTPLITLVSKGNVPLHPGRITQAIGEAAATPVAQGPITEFAAELTGNLEVYLANVLVIGALGHGPVPAYDLGSIPPVNAGPVVNGSCYSEPGTPLLSYEFDEVYNYPL